MKFMTGTAILAAQLCALTTQAQAQDIPPSASAAADTADDEGIIVTGTRDARRTRFDALAPVDVLSSNALDAGVSGDLNTKLAQLLPSFNVQRLPAADGQAFVRPATLRGLSADQTLVLVNGKRYHRSALLGTRGAQAPDLASIPNLSIKRIEVLRDGASAQYGSDAIAGVINIILDDQPGMEAYSQFSQYYRGDGDSYQGGMQGGVALGERGSLVFTGEYSRSAATSRTRQRPDARTFQANHPGLAVPDPVQRWGQPKLESIKGSVNAHYDLSDAATLYAFIMANEGSGVTDFNWRNPDGTASVFKATPAFPGFSFTSIYPTGFTPRFGTDYSDLQADGGLRGALGERLTYDLSAAFGRSLIDYTLKESLNASLGPTSPTSFYLGRLTQKEFNLNADFVYRLPVAGLAEPVNIAFGGERRVETYAIGAGDPASYAIGPGAVYGLAPNSNGFPGFSPVSAGSWDQTSYAAYLDTEVRPTGMLTLGAATRYEHFSSFGDTVNYKLSARLEPVRGLAFRGTYSTGFRAPTPGQVNAINTSQGLDTVTLQVFNAGRLSPNDPIAAALGAKPLKPEKSDTLTGGVTFRSGGFSGSVDAYQIKLRDRFSQSASFAVPTSLPNPQRFTSVSFFTNDFDTRTRGVDVVLAYTQALGPGKADVSLAYNYNRTKVTGGTSAAMTNATQRILFEERLPRHNGTASLGYTIGRFGMQVRGRYYGPWTDVSGNATGDLFQRFGSMVLVDLSASAQLTPNLSLRAGAENLFNRYPAEATNQAVRGLIYSRNAPYDTDGGRYYVRMGLTF